MNILPLRAGALFMLGMQTMAVVGAIPGSVVPDNLPPPDPGYRIYYHGSLGEAETVVRWAYHEGWQQGRADRNRGVDVRPQDTDPYKTAPEHGNTPKINRTQYQRLYREAFSRGYEHGHRP